MKTKSNKRRKPKTCSVRKALCCVVVGGSALVGIASVTVAILTGIVLASLFGPEDQFYRHDN